MIAGRIFLLGDSEVERKVLLQAGRLNLCQCYLKLGKWIEARNVCDKVGRLVVEMYI